MHAAQATTMRGGLLALIRLVGHPISNFRASSLTSAALAETRIEPFVSAYMMSIALKPLTRCFAIITAIAQCDYLRASNSASACPIKQFLIQTSRTMPRKPLGCFMSRLNLMLFAAWPSVCLIAVVGIANGAGAEPLDSDPYDFTGSDICINEIMTWLPEDVASIMVARRPRIPARNPDPASGERRAESNPAKTPIPKSPAGPARANRVRRSQTTAQGPREPGDGPTIFSRLGPSYALFVKKHRPCLGVRALRHPDGDNTTKQSNTHDAIEVLAFSADVQVGDVMLVAERNGTTKRIDGKKVVAFGAGEKAYFASPKRNVLVATTTADCMRIVLQRLTSTLKLRRALPGDLLEWRHVNTEADMWGLHHVASKKTDPAARKKMTSVGLTFWYKNDDKRQITVRCVSSGDDGKDELVALTERLTGRAISVRSIAPGSYEAKIPADTAAWFLVELIMGYPVSP